MTAAAFQSTVSLSMASGVIGELYTKGPQIARSMQLQSVSAANNVFGRGFSYLSQGVVRAGNAGSAVFAGILVNPKNQMLIGDGNNPLNPSFVLPNYVNADFLTEGSIFVSLTVSAAIGDLVCYNNTTGILQTISPGANLPVGTSFAYAFVDYFTVTTSGGAPVNAIITMQPGLPIPVLA